MQQENNTQNHPDKVDTSKKVGFLYHLDTGKHSFSYENLRRGLQHPDNPERLLQILAKINGSDFKNELNIISEFDECTEEDILSTHSKEHLSNIKKAF